MSDTRYCIPCTAHYVDGFHRCPSCGSRTVDELENRMWHEVRDGLTNEEMVAVRLLDGPVDKAILTEIMSDNNVPWVVHGPTNDAFAALHRSQTGWGVLMVLEEFVPRAQELVRLYDEAVIPEPAE